MSELYAMGLFGNQLSRTHVNDIYYTPDNLAKDIVKYFKPKGKILEPCAGAGAFLRALPDNTEWCEIEKQKNFFEYKDKVDWIVTNPPFSKITHFLNHSFKISNNVVFLLNVAALFTVKRIRLIKQHNFAIKEIRFVKQPDTFPQTGRIPGAVYFEKHFKGNTKISYENKWDDSYKKIKQNILCQK